VAQVPDDGPKRAQPPGAKDDVVPGQGHDEEVGRERLAINEERCVTDDAGAGNALPVGHQSGETGLLLEREAGSPRCVLRDKVVRAAGVEEGDKCRGAQRHGNLHGARHGNSGHVLEGETGRLGGVLRRCCPIRRVIDLHALDEEQAPAETVMAAGIFFIAVKT
jgi:hypothetical protein